MSANSSPWRYGNTEQLIVLTEQMGAAEVSKRLETIRDMRAEFEKTDEGDVTRRLKLAFDLISEWGVLCDAMKAETARREAERAKANEQQQQQQTTPQSNSGSKGFWSRLRGA